MKGKKIALFCAENQDHFIKEIFEHFAKNNEIRRFKQGEITEMIQIALWSDISFFEWVTDAVKFVSKMDLPCQKIVRLHRVEAYNKIVTEVNWQNIDDLIVVAPHMKQLIEFRVPESKQAKITIIPESVNMDRFPLKENIDSEYYNIGYLGNLVEVKNPALLLQCFKYIKDHWQGEKKVKFHVAGKFLLDEIKDYFEYAIKFLGLEKDLSMWGWVKSEEYLKGLNALISSSSSEGFPVGVLEAMASGVKPAVHNFYGSAGLYPDSMTWDTVEQCYKIIISEDRPEDYREWASQFSTEKTVAKIEKLVDQHEA